MTQTTGTRPVWVDLGSQDAAGSRAFYSALFGWVAEPNPDPQYGGYAVATHGGKDVAGIGPAQSPEQPTAWSLYLGTSDADALGASIAAHGGAVIAPPFPVGEMGRMAVFQDPVGAFISAWETGVMGGFAATGSGSFVWAELNARGLAAALAFYQGVFGWGAKTSPMPDGGAYTELLDGETSILGALEMAAMVPEQVPSYWLVYFASGDIAGDTAQAQELGATVLLPPTDMPGGQFAILSDPQGAAVGLLAMDS
jgi:predicted enzyme related to lactoylglutathione lyase